MKAMGDAQKKRGEWKVESRPRRDNSLCVAARVGNSSLFYSLLSLLSSLFFRPSAEKMAGTGFEPPVYSKGNSSFPKGRGAKSGAREAAFDPLLATIVEAWPRLPEAIRAGVLAMIRATERSGMN